MWLSFEDLDSSSEQTKRIKNVLRTANFPYLSSYATKLKQANTPSSSRDSSDSQIGCVIDTSQFASGYKHVVLEIKFSDAISWVARIGLSDESESDKDAETAMLSEIATMRVVQAKTSIPIPTVRGFEVSKVNEFGFRYMLLDKLDGHHLERCFAFSVPLKYRDKVANHFADYYYRLSKIRYSKIGRIWSGGQLNEEPQIISSSELDNSSLQEVEPSDQAKATNPGPHATSLEYFYFLQKQQSREIRNVRPGDPDFDICAAFLEKALPSMVLEQNIYGPFPLCHLDLHFNNILVDDDYNITGIIDWSDAQTVPLERFAASPEFVTFPGLSAEENEPIRDFRASFIAALKEREMEDSDITARGMTTPLWQLVGSPLAELVFRCTCSYPWRALSDARLVMRLLYGPSATWEAIRSYHLEAPIHQ